MPEPACRLVKPTPAIPRALHPILSRLLEKRLDSPVGADESVHSTSLLSALLEDDLSKVSEGITTLAEMQTVGGFGFYTAGTGKSA